MFLQRVPEAVDILILNCPHWNPEFPPPGPLHVHEAVKAHGLSSSFLDVNLLLYRHSEVVPVGSVNETSTGEYHSLWDSHLAHRWMDETFVMKNFSDAIENLARETSTKHAISVGFSVSVFSRVFSLALAKAIKEHSPDLPIIFGGFECLYPEILPHYSNVPDYYVVGEAEGSAPLLLKAIRSAPKGKKVYNIPGVITNDEKGFQSFKPIMPPQNLDSIAYPTYSDVDFGDYAFRNRRLAFVGATRGCSWGRCTFCSVPGDFRARSPEHVLEEMSYLHGELGVSHFSFTDQDANNSPETLQKICDLIIQKRLHRKITLDGQLRVSKRNDVQFFRKLRKAGFSYASFGLESGCNKVLRLMRKGITRELAAANFRAAQEAGFGVGINIIVGFPGETYEDFIETLRWLVANRNLFDQLESLSVAQLLRSSYLADHPQEYGLHSDSMYGALTPVRCCDNWTTSLNSQNTRANRELRRYLLLSVMRNMGVPVGSTLQLGQEPCLEELGENERQLWDLVAERLQVNLASTGSQSAAQPLTQRAWRYYRRNGGRKLVRATLDFLTQRLSNPPTEQ